MADYHDCAYGWVVVTGAFFNLFLMIGLAKSMGIIFVEMIAVYQAPTSTIAVLFSLATGCSMFTAPLATALADVYTCRVVSITGGLIMCAGLIIASAVPSLNSIIYSYGILCGLGINFCLTPAPVLVSRYFDKKRSLANGITFTGTGLGGLVMPLVVHCVLEEYGLHPSFMILAAITLHSIVFSSLYRPVSFYDKKQVHKIEVPNEIPSSDVSAMVKHRNVPRTLVPVCTLEPIVENVESEQMSRVENENQVVRKKSASLQQLTNFENSTFHLQRWTSHQSRLCGDFHVPQAYLSTINLSGALSFQDIPSTLLTPREEEMRQKTIKGQRSVLDILKAACIRTDSQGKQTVLFDVHLLCHPSFLVLTIGNMCGFVGHHINMILPPHCVETLGWSRGRTASLLSLMGIADVLGRLCTGLVSDKPIFNKRRVALAGTYIFCVGIATASVPFVEQFWAVLILNMCAQFCFGGFAAIATVVLMDVVGIDRMSNAWGLSLFCEGISICTAPLMIGYLRDVTGNYLISFLMLATSFILSSVAFVIIQIKWMNKKGAQCN